MLPQRRASGYTRNIIRIKDHFLLPVFLSHAAPFFGGEGSGETAWQYFCVFAECIPASVSVME